MQEILNKLTTDERMTFIACIQSIIEDNPDYRPDEVLNELHRLAETKHHWDCKCAICR